MQIDILTKEDLNSFKGQLLEDIKSLLQPDAKPQIKWLSSSEVRRQLKISQSSLQNLRIKENLKTSKILGTVYYQAEDLERIFEKNANRK